MKNNKTDSARQIAMLVLLLCIVNFIAGCKQKTKETNSFHGEREKVTIGIASLVRVAPILIAQEKGYFADEGLDVVIKEYAFGKLALEGMFSGQADLATVADTPIVFYSFKREDFAILATFVYNYDDSKIVVRADSGIKSASDLKGKKVGATLGTSAQFFLDTLLSYNDLLGSDIKVINITAKDLPGALESGKVDAISVFEPYAHQAMQLLKRKTMRLPKTEIYRETFNLVVMKRFAEERPEILKKVLKAVDRSISFARQNKKEAIAIIGQRLNQDVNVIEAAWENDIFGLSLDQAVLFTLEDQARWAIKNRLTDQTQVPNFLNFIYLDGLLAVKPAAVTIIR